MQNEIQAKGSKDVSCRVRLNLESGDIKKICAATGYCRVTVSNVLRNGTPNNRIWACYNGIIAGRKLASEKLRDKLIARELSKAQAREMEVI